MTLAERISAAGHTETVTLSGIQQPATKDGSFVMNVSPAQAGLSRATEIVHGSSVYVHYPILDTLHARDPQVRSWILVNTSSSLGLDPTSFSSLGGQELQELSAVKLEGAATLQGQAVTNYGATIDWSKAKRLPQFAQLLSHLPSASAALLHGSDRLTYAVGADGYVHGMTTTLSVPVQGATLSVAIAVTLEAIDQVSAPISAPPAADVMTLAQFNQITGTGASSAQTALLARVALKPSQVGQRYVLGQIPGGHLVQGETTLDFCGLSYQSEQLRTARLQVIYTDKASSLQASNEVVTYASGGAQEALGEVKHAAAICHNGTVGSPAAGVKDLVRHTQVVADPRLLPGSVAIMESDSATVHGKRVSYDSMAVYQVRGEVLSGVYGYGNSAAAVRSLTLRAAEQSAANLKRYVAPSVSQPASGGFLA